MTVVKNIFFGKVRAIQIRCPNCNDWQFESSVCDNCDYNFNQNVSYTSAKPEYRSQINTWRDKIKDSIRKEVYKRDNFICQYCGIYCLDNYLTDDKSLTLDHLTPFTAGGNSKVENLVTCCRECNFIKNNKRFDTFEKAREYILKRKNNYVMD